MLNIRLMIIVAGIFNGLAQSTSSQYQGLVSLSERLHKWEIDLQNIHPGDGISVVVGLSGSGKSTLTNFATGQPLMSVQNYTDYSISIVRMNDTDPPCCYIGSQYASETSVPYVLGRFVDMPGFDDNRGPLAEIRNSYVVNAFVKQNSPIQLLVCIPQYYLEPYQRAERMAELLRYLQPLVSLNSINRFEEIVTVVITSATDVDPAVTKYHFSRMIREAPNLSPEAKQILSVWTQKDFNRISYFERPSSVKIFSTQEYSQELPVQPSPPLRGIHFSSRRSLAVCTYVHDMQRQMRMDIDMIFEELLVEVRTVLRQALIGGISNGRAQYIRADVEREWAQLKHFSESCARDECCCGDRTVLQDGYSQQHLVDVVNRIIKRTFLLDPLTGERPAAQIELEHRIIAQLEIVCGACDALQWLTQSEQSPVAACPNSVSQSSFSSHLQLALGQLVHYLGRLAAEPAVSCGTSVSGNRRMIRMTGNIIGTSDVLALAARCSSLDMSFLLVDIVVKHFFVFDEDLSLPSGRVRILSRRCLIAGNRTLNLSGSSAGQCREVTGRPGNPGAPGGHLLCSCEDWLILEQHRNINGGLKNRRTWITSDEKATIGDSALHVISRGGTGEEGCPGANGSDGAVGVAGSRKGQSSQLEEAYLHRVYSGIIADTHVYRSGVFGTRGGDGKKGGKGGQGGRPGKVIFLQPQLGSRVHIVEREGWPGMDGVGGRGGKGGVHASVYEHHVYVTSKELYNCLLVSLVAMVLAMLVVAARRAYAIVSMCPTESWFVLPRTNLLSWSGTTVVTLLQAAAAWPGFTEYMQKRSALHMLAMLSALAATLFVGVKVFVIDRIASDDVEWTGYWGGLAGESYEVDSPYYKAPDGHSGGCCIAWPGGEGFPEELDDITMMDIVVLNDDFLY